MTGKKAVFLGVGVLVLAVLVVKTIFFLVEFLQPNRLPARDWAIYQENFISPEGRVIDTGNGNVSHSEGQGYGMIIAAAYGDRRVFDRIWEWTQKNLQTRPGDKLLSWQWKPNQTGGEVSDPNNASDGDLLVAWALTRAFKQWGDYRYQQAAAQILADLAGLDVVETKGDGLILLPGTDGFVHDDIYTLNPSYYIFPAFKELGEAFPGTPWPALIESGEALIAKARFGQDTLTPDWIQLIATPVPAAVVASPIADQSQAVTESEASPSPSEPLGQGTPSPEPTAGPSPTSVTDSSPSPRASPASTEPTPAASETSVTSAEVSPSPTPDLSPTLENEVAQKSSDSSESTPHEIAPERVAVSDKFPPLFGYNAVRIPLHLAWQNPESPDLLPFATFWKRFPDQHIPATINVLDNVVGTDPALPGMKAIAALTIACVDKQVLTVRSLPVLTKGDSYFSASLSILAKIAVRELFAK